MTKMASIDFSLDSRVKKTYVPLLSQQLHLRHLKRIAARNLKLLSEDCEVKQSDLSINPIGFQFAMFTTDEQLIYESEILDSTSPEWKTFESSSFKYPVISELIVRLYYCQTIETDLLETIDNNLSIDNSSDKTLVKCFTNNLFIEWNIHLNGLVFIGEEIPKDNRFKDNTIILGLMEGFYTSLESIASHEFSKQLSLRRESILVTDTTTLRNSYCLNVLYRIEMMQRVITQTLVLVNNTRTKLEDKFNFMSDKSELKSKVELMEVRVKTLRHRLTLSQQRLFNSREIKSKNENEICEKGIDMLNKIQTLKQQKEKLSLKMEKLGQTREKLIKTRAQLMIRRKQFITEISNIYPLVPFPDGNGGFSICGVHLPDSESFDGHDDTMISIGIGYVTHILVLISRLLDAPLRYQMIYFGSRSSIVDHLNDKISENDRLFPLHSKSGKDKLHFKYGVFLMNKNIAQLRHYLGLYTKDLSATLPNLYSLLKERLVLLNEELSPQNLNGMAASSSHSSQNYIEDYLRREIEAMRVQQELQEAGPFKANAIRLRNFSNVSNNSIRINSDNRNISLSLDKGLNEIVPNSSSKSVTNESVSSSLSSDSHSNIIPKHLLNSNQIHHNFSETDFKKVIERNRSGLLDKNYLKWCEPSDEDLTNEVNTNRASSSGSSPPDQVWNDANHSLNNDKHSDK